MAEPEQGNTETTLSIPETVFELLVVRLNDAYQAVHPECRSTFWQAILAICDLIASGRVNGQLILHVDFSLSIADRPDGVRVDKLRLENLLLDLPGTYDSIVLALEKCKAKSTPTTH